MNRQISRNGKLVVAAAALALLIGSGIAYAQAKNARTFTSDTLFEVVDPSEPIISTNVNGGFVNQSITVQVNMSSQQGVSQLKGTYTIIVQLYDDNKSAFVDFQTLASNQPIALTPTTTLLTYAFTTSTPGYYNLRVDFTATSWSTG